MTEPSAYPYRPPVRLRNGLGVASLVIAIVAIVSCAPVLGPIPGIVAVLMGFAAWRRVKRGEANNGGMAMAGIVLGFVAIVVSSLVFGYISYPFLKDERYYLDCTSVSHTKGHPECEHIRHLL